MKKFLGIFAAVVMMISSAAVTAAAADDGELYFYDFADYDVEMMEIHHNRKKDAPSGTALRLAECLAEAKDWSLAESACYHREGIIGERPAKEIGIQTLRGGDVVGVHTVYFMGPGERIEVTHQAHSRENFANGALRAIRWMHGRAPGKLYSMQDILG